MRWRAECTACSSVCSSGKEYTVDIWADRHERENDGHRVVVDHEPFERDES